MKTTTTTELPLPTIMCHSLKEKKDVRLFFLFNSLIILIIPLDYY